MKGFRLLLILVAVHSTFSLRAQCPIGQEEVTIEITTDLYGFETTWALFSQSSGQVASGGPYGANTTYYETVCVNTSECYRFVIYDDFGDGICCTYGPGSYAVYYGLTLVGSGSVFASSATVYGIGTCTAGTPLVTDHTTYTPQELVSDVLLGSCVEAFNIAYTGALPAVSYFSGGASIGMESGILLTTGDTDVAPGPNSTDDAGYSPGTPGDATLELVTGFSPTYEAASLEFDFISFNDTVTFRYIFASEEYNEYVCSPYNDVFAFLVSGTGYAPNTNIALVPGTSTAVAINSVNNGTPGDALGFPYDPNDCVSLSNTAYYVDNTGGLTTQFDGYTVPLTATMVVIPCDTYHIKLVIADVGDGLYDSGVFLEAESFTGGQGVGVVSTTIDGTKNAYEGCADGKFTFFRLDSASIADAVTVNFTLSGNATEGTDFLAIPRTITIPANEYSTELNIATLLDGNTETSERVIITYPDPCSCNSFKRDTLFIFDNQPLTASIAGNDTLCLGQSTLLTAAGAGSTSRPYHYSWSTLEVTSSITPSPASSATYTVTVTDACAGQTATASYPVSVVPAVNAAFTTNSPQCLSQNSFDFNNTSTYTGVAGFNWNFGDATTAITEDVTGHSYSNSGTFTVSLVVSVNGCTDTATQNVTVTNSVTTTRAASICPDSSVFAGGAMQNTAGVYYDTFTSANGCDSVVITNLTVLPYLVMNQLAVICDGDSFFAAGEWQFTQGVYHDTFPQVADCDRIVITELTVFNNSSSAVNASICEGETYFAGGAFQNADGTYYDTLSSANGCDSVVATTLAVHDTSVTAITASICVGDSFYAGGAWRFSPGIYYDSLLNSNGCDSVVSTTLSILSNSFFSQNASICDGDSFFAGGAFQYADGTYYDTLNAANGCDSIVATNLTVLGASVANIMASICDGDSFFAGGAWRFVPGTYEDTFAAFNGCDSIIFTVLDVRSRSYSSMNVSICEGDSFFAAGAFQTTTGVYFDTLLSANNCDSIITTNLLVNDTSITHVSAFICQGDSFFAGGIWQTSSGVYSDYLSGTSGCDSTVITTLTVAGVINIQNYISICAGESYFAGGAAQTVSGIYIDSFIANAGCDSIVTTQLTVADTFFSSNTVSICEGDSIFAGGAWQKLSGVFIDIFTTSSGCDSTVVTNLTVIATIQTNIDTAICAGESYFAGGALQTASGVYIDSFTAAGGCDSIVTTQLTVADTFITNITAAICAGDSFFAGGVWRFAPGNYFDFLASEAGCDSTVVTTLSVASTLQTPISAMICAGENYFAGGALQTSSGIYVDSFIAAGGCDSIVTTTLMVLDTFTNNVTLSICEGDSLYAGGNWQTTAGIYIDSLLTSGGCDSVVITALSIIPTVSAQIDTSICSGETYFAGGAFQDSSGTYTDVFISTTGCDSILTTQLTVIEISVTGDTTTVCTGENATLAAAGGFDSYLWLPGGENTSSVTVSSGSYQLLVSDASGCTATAFYWVNENDSIALRAVPPTDTIIEGESADIRLLYSSSADIQTFDWSPADGLNCTNCANAEATPSDDVVYTIIATDGLGCTDTVTVSIIVDTLLDPLVYIPNAFTPNGDGENDAFMIYGQGFTDFHLMIFDRWGEKLFESFSQSTGWDGTFRGKLCNPGVYVYYVDARFVRNEKPRNYTDYIKGSVTLIR